MKKLFINILKRTREINFRPASEWQAIKDTPVSAKWHMKNYIIPITLVISIVTFLGYYFELNYLEIPKLHILLIAFIKTLSALCKAFFTFYLTFQIVQELSPKFEINNKNENLFKLLTYSFSAFWTMLFLAGILANYKSLGSFFIFMGLYGIFPFWVGSDILLELPPDKKNKLLAVSLVIAILVYLLIDWSFGFALRAAHLAGMMN
jgi:hypothetical protein